MAREKTVWYFIVFDFLYRMGCNWKYAILGEALFVNTSAEAQIIQPIPVKTTARVAMKIFISRRQHGADDAAHAVGVCRGVVALAGDEREIGMIFEMLKGKVGYFGRTRRLLRTSKIYC